MDNREVHKELLVAGGMVAQRLANVGPPSEFNLTIISKSTQKQKRNVDQPKTLPLPQDRISLCNNSAWAF